MIQANCRRSRLLCVVASLLFVVASMISPLQTVHAQGTATLPGPCDIPKRLHHTPTGWVDHIRTLVKSGSTRSPFVGQLRVYVAEERVGWLRSGLTTTVTIAAYITACEQWIFIKYRKIRGSLRFVTHFFPDKGLTYIKRSVARDAVRYIVQYGKSAAQLLERYWVSAFFMFVPDCVDWSVPPPFSYANCFDGGSWPDYYTYDKS